jgi:hypothetical protein
MHTGKTAAEMIPMTCVSALSPCQALHDERENETATGFCLRSI